jgi:UDP-N-acetylmuramate--alanine ligase
LPCFTLVAEGKAQGQVQLSIPGVHQVYNALAAAAAARICGLPWTPILNGLARCEGVSRRMEYRGQVGGAAVYNDYGHHPTEVRATLAGAAALCGTHPDGTPGDLICVFQPHTYSRTARLYRDFLTAFDQAHRVFLVDIYAARETDTLGVSSAGLAADLGERASYCPTPVQAAAAVRAAARPGDVVVIMGAGDVGKVETALLAAPCEGQALKEDCP